MRGERRVIDMRLGFAWLALTTLLAAGCKQQEAAPAPAQSPAESQQTPVSAPMQPGASRPSPMPTLGSESTDTPTSDDLPQKRKAEDLSLPEAEKALDEAATTLNQLLGSKGAAGDATRLSAGDPRCPEACKAMGSLRRAAAAVCRLAGDATERCSRAKTIVKDSQLRLAACKCDPDKD
jgi:hypothetical protein